jgi:hypothetical protein
MSISVTQLRTTILVRMRPLSGSDECCYRAEKCNYGWIQCYIFNKSSCNSIMVGKLICLNYLLGDYLS